MFIIVEKGIPEFRIGEMVNGTPLSYRRHMEDGTPLYLDETLVRSRVSYHISGDPDLGQFFYLSGSPVTGYTAVIVTYTEPYTEPVTERISLANDGIYSIGNTR
ncbi:hypothetical protein COS66_00795 [Candidatus Berkelbacteria bacterium CG06_land_8_20_14_3_00_43_10]|uniref:Uncharacterized protein n=1 Tax=Candidatus Berkelbacteria bacterium CG10_big_fil_rev_8_21_14_0_10_43_14 TaxID=1974515 RepID=A0A2M6R7X1_9BACT|nr:MAG: hypothetical protein AUK41_01405 [Candidatus Berkelbacteria bacterium CG2_30_43_20]PIS06626.1 MAG: hypothetical protein COT79_03610 [Candidatus Berkelbacteria bacterium CG10_big_fil_rev_8_21_14_0_10_43_14]PIU87443.1 MAG: hypothetical protein COS66_00795 [Candidatus Berkelbacteria bacterium CG06_land_8_20_14_3_00_43_10]